MTLIAKVLTGYGVHYVYVIVNATDCT